MSANDIVETKLGVGSGQRSRSQAQNRQLRADLMTAIREQIDH
ncbi:hypothetical protein [Rhodococcus rhodochrous]|nr:hypothetical protein [Rhodococcus rhodochrous]